MARASESMPETVDVRAYLLGTASESEVEAIESSCFADESAVDRVAEVEDDLIADYLDDRLDPDERARFERHYLASPPHRERVALARALRQKAGGRDTAPRWRVLRGPRPVVIAALAAALILWLAIRPALRERPDSGPREVVALLTVPAAVLRSGGQLPTLELDATTTRVELRLERGESELVPPLLATIRTIDGDVVWSGAAAPPAAAAAAALAAIVTLPPAALASGDYFLALSPDPPSDEADASERYAFRVRRR